jgi:hypothetical protein
MSSRTIKMTARDNRFGSQSLVSTTITSTTPVSDIGGQAKYLRYIQIEKTSAGTLTSPGHAYLNVYNTGEVSVSDVATAKVICHADIATDEYITLISADGTSRKYVAKAANDYDETDPEFDASGTATQTATALAGAIVATTNHLNKFIVVQSTDTLTITNVTSGASGNTAIAETFNVAATVPAAFTGGSDNAYTEPVMRIQYPVITSATTPYAVVIPFGYYFDTTVSFSITEKDKSLIGEVGGGSSPSMTVRMVVS